MDFKLKTIKLGKDKVRLELWVMSTLVIKLRLLRILLEWKDTGPSTILIITHPMESSVYLISQMRNLLRTLNNIGYVR